MFGKERLTRQPAGRRFGDSEVDDLDARPAILRGYKYVARLDVSMNDPFGMGVLNARTNLVDQRQPIGDAHVVFVAVLDDRIAPNELHHKIGSAGFGRARIEYLGDVGM